MTPKEKAIELVNKYYQNYQDNDVYGDYTNGPKQCALIAVDEIIKLEIFDCNDEWSNEDGDTREYWLEVKTEIEKL